MYPRGTDKDSVAASTLGGNPGAQGSSSSQVKSDIPVEQTSASEGVDTTSSSTSATVIKSSVNVESSQSDVPPHVQTNAAVSNVDESVDPAPPKKKFDSEYLPGIEIPLTPKEMFPNYFEQLYQFTEMQQASFAQMAKSLEGLTNDVLLNGIYFQFPFVQHIVAYNAR